MFRQALSGLGCGGDRDCGCGMGVVQASAMFTNRAPVNGLHGLGDFGDFSTNDSGEAIGAGAYVPPLDLSTLSDLPIMGSGDYNPNSLAPGASYSWGSNIPLGAKTTSGQPVTAAQIASLIAQAAGGANAVYRSLQSPYVVPGTNVLYNPATGQYASATGASFQGGALNLSGIMPLLIVGVIVFAVAGRGGR